MADRFTVLVYFWDGREIGPAIVSQTAGPHIHELLCCLYNLSDTKGESPAALTAGFATVLHTRGGHGFFITNAPPVRNVGGQLSQIEHMPAVGGAGAMVVDLWRKTARVRGGYGFGEDWEPNGFNDNQVRELALLPELYVDGAPPAADAEPDAPKPEPVIQPARVTCDCGAVVEVPRSGNWEQCPAEGCTRTIRTTKRGEVRAMISKPK